MSDKIEQFRGEYRWLSNFHEAPIVYMGKTYKTTEHMYQALKTLDEKQRLVIESAEKAGEAKRLGDDPNTCTMRPNWNIIRIKVMFMAVLCKFTQHADLAEKLLATGDAVLEEGNNWGDEFWGVVDGRGMNWLGTLLMTVRDMINIEK